MMPTQTLYLLRHAKSSWKDPTLSDFDRPLNKRGRHDAPLIASRLLEQSICPDRILSSPAERAKCTAQIVGPKLGQTILYHPEIYEASATTLQHLVESELKTVDSLMLIGHNPGLTELHNRLCSEAIENIPTSGIVGLSFEKGHISKGRRLFFLYPKQFY
jgi:phosphohistidine phosphatase